MSTLSTNISQAYASLFSIKSIVEPLQTYEEMAIKRHISSVLVTVFRGVRKERGVFIKSVLSALCVIKLKH